MIEDREDLSTKFGRFVDDELNGISDDKLHYAGQWGLVVETYDDYTVTIRFEDGE